MINLVNINFSDERLSALNSFSKKMNFSNINCIFITGSSTVNLSTSKSDLDIRIIVDNFNCFTDDLQDILIDEKIISNNIKAQDNFAEVKFFFNNIPFHLLYYNLSYVTKSIEENNKNIFDTIINGKIIYIKESVIEPIIQKCNLKVNDLSNNKEYYLASKSQFVKGIARYEKKEFEESLFCIRTASIYLLKEMLLNNGILNIKDQWLIRDFYNISSNYENDIVEDFKIIHGLNDISEDLVKQSISHFSNMLSKYEKVKS